MAAPAGRAAKRAWKARARAVERRSAASSSGVWPGCIMGRTWQRRRGNHTGAERRREWRGWRAEALDLFRQDLAQAQQGALLEARDVHLGDVEFAGDLGLGQFIEEAQVDHLTLAHVQAVQRAAQVGVGVDVVQGAVDLADDVQQRGAVAAGVGVQAGVQRDGAGDLADLQGLDGVVLGRADLLGDLADRGRAAQPDRKVCCALRALRDSSWSQRGTLTCQVLSRKWRLISPTMVGMA